MNVRSSIRTLLCVTRLISITLGCCGSLCLAKDAANEFRSNAFLATYCVDCHSGEKPAASFSIQRLLQRAQFNDDFRAWQKVATAITNYEMPPKDATQPTDSDRKLATHWVQQQIDQAARSPSPPALMRRLTRAEYAYTIGDLTGSDVDLWSVLPEDSAGPTGFANSGVAQFADETILQRYLDAAKIVAEHAVINAGPIWFADGIGPAAQELATIDRIQRFHAEHGFRGAVSERGELYGMQKYNSAFEISWLFRHRAILQMPDVTLQELATDFSIPSPFVEHIWQALHRTDVTGPTASVAAAWHSLPAPTSAPGQPGSRLIPEPIRMAVEDIVRGMTERQTRLAGIPADRDDVKFIYESEIPVIRRHADFKRTLQRSARTLHQPERIEPALPCFLRVENSDPDVAEIPQVIVKNVQVRYFAHGEWTEPKPFRDIFDESIVEPTNWLNKLATSETVVIPPNITHRLEIPRADAASRIEVSLQLEVAAGSGLQGVVRCLFGSESEFATGNATALFLGDPDSPSVADWYNEYRTFAGTFPQVTHRPAAPSDRDFVPRPFVAKDREVFHRRLKYNRDDGFLVQHMLNDKQRQQLDQHWTNLLTSFDYHDIFLQFLVERFDLPDPPENISAASEEWIARLPRHVSMLEADADGPLIEHDLQTQVRQLKADYEHHQQVLIDSAKNHMQQVMQFASRAWRRPVTSEEAQRLKHYYSRLRTESAMPHDSAVRIVLTRILVSPEFLYRAESLAVESTADPAVNDYQTASRLSYLVWSSLPDDRLLSLASNDRLRETPIRIHELRRMCSDVKARRFADEFFGQWLGIYDFNRFEGVDRRKFPEFDQTLQQSMTEEASRFFLTAVQENRPVSDLLDRRQITMNKPLAQHYHLPFDDAGPSWQTLSLDENNRRGGLMGLSAILTATSAPSRTSPVKRGDWILRRLLGTPVPPPPADAGSISPEETMVDAATVRQQMERHRENDQCMRCHLRMDPLGFSLESFDAIGRDRANYPNGTPVNDADQLLDGTKIEGPAGLRRYLLQQRSLFEQNLCRQLIGYTFGRAERASDQVMMRAMSDRLRTNPKTGIVDLLEIIVGDSNFISVHSSEKEFGR